MAMNNVRKIRDWIKVEAKFIARMLGLNGITMRHLRTESKIYLNLHCTKEQFFPFISQILASMRY